LQRQTDPKFEGSIPDTVKTINNWHKNICFIIEQVASNKSRLVLKNILQNAQTLQLFAKLTKTKFLQKVPSWKAWLMRPSGLINIERKHQHF
jgi:hypothetical protein